MKILNERGYTLTEYGKRYVEGDLYVSLSVEYLEDLIDIYGLPITKSNSDKFFRECGYHRNIAEEFFNEFLLHGLIH